MSHHAKRNFWLLVGDAGFFSLAYACFDPNVVLPVFVLQFTNSPLLIGAPAAIALAGLYLPQLPVAVLIRHLQHIKSFFFWQAAIGRGALFGCAAAAALAGLPPELLLALFFLAWAVFSFTEGAATLAWLDLVGEVIAPRMRGRYFGVLQLLGGVLSVGAGLAVREILNGDLSAATFAPLFASGWVAFGLSVACIGLVREGADTPKPAVNATAWSQVRLLARDPHLIKLSAAQLFASSLRLALPFYVLYGREELGLGSEWLGSFIVAQTIGTSLAAVAWARLAERRGARPVVCGAAALLILIPVLAGLAAVAPPTIMLLGVFLLVGAARGGSQAGFWQYTLEVTPARDRRVFVGLVNTANAPSLLMPVVGGAILELGGYPWLFGTAALLGLGATLSGLMLAPGKQ